MIMHRSIASVLVTGLSLVVVSLFAVGAGVVATVGIGRAQESPDVFGHLKCYKIKKDSAPKASYTADLVPEQIPPFSVETGCTVTVPAKYFCIDVGKINVQPTPPLPLLAGTEARDYLCYQIKCKTPALSPLLVEDQFGLRTITISQSQYLCAPADKPCAPLPSSTVAWWQLEETSGTTVADSIDGSIGTSQPGPIGAGGPTSVVGMVGNALNFSGTQFVDVLSSPATDLGALPSDPSFTIDAWVNPATNQGILPIVDKRTNAQNIMGYTLFLSNGVLSFQMADGVGTICNCGHPGSACTSYASSATVLVNSWTHVAVTVSPGANNGKFYVNGNPKGTFTPRSGSLSNSADLWIGRRHPNPCGQTDLYWQGDLDEVEMSNTALSQVEIATIVAAGSKGKCVTCRNGGFCCSSGPLGQCFDTHCVVDADCKPPAFTEGGLGGFCACN